MNADTPNITQRIIRPTRARRLFLSALCFPIVIYFGFQAGALFRSRPHTLTVAAALTCLAVGANFAWFALRLLSVRVELGPTAIVCRSMFGRKALTISEIISAVSTSSRWRALDIRTADHRLGLAAGFSAAQLQEIQDYICQRTAGSPRQVETTRPPITATTVLIVVALTIPLLTGAVLVGWWLAPGREGRSSNSARCNARHAAADLRISACTAIIQAGDETTTNLARVLTNRGTAYTDKRDYDSAIQDFDQAIGFDPTLAIAFNDRGNTFNEKHAYDRAISDLNEAIRLDPNYVSPYINRGNAFYGKGEYDRAIEDDDEAIKLAPNNATAYSNRGSVYSAKGEYDRAIQDFDRAIRLEPTLDGAFRGRGIANFLSGRFSEAATDLERGPSVGPSDLYIALWLHLARQRLGQDDTQEFSDRVARADPDHWPAAVAKLYLGQATQDQVLAAASSPNAKTQEDQHCEAAFYLGEYAALHRNVADATLRLREASETCDRTFTEYWGAVAELGRLGK
jgi:lipoprotein NlpI